MKYITINMLSGQTVIDKIVPTDALDTYPTHAAIYGLGGYRSVANITDRNAIPAQRREEGMAVYVADAQTRYILQGGITNSDWVIDTSGGGGGGGGGGGNAPLPTPTIVPVYQTVTKGAGYQNTYQLTEISNGSLSNAFDVTKVEILRPVEVVFANGKPVYDNLFPRTKSHRITGTVDNTGLVTLSGTPYSGYSADIQIHFYYKLTSAAAISNYYYNDILTTPEVDTDTYASDIPIYDLANNFTATDVEGALVELNTKATQTIQEVVIVQKNPSTGQFSSIEAALASISDNSSTKPYLISVAPGIYTENPLTMKPYVYIEGSGEQETVIRPVTNTNTIINGVANSLISKLQLTGASGVGGKAVNCSNMASVNPFLIFRVLFAGNETQVAVSSTVAVTLVKMSQCTTGGATNFTYGFTSTSSNAAQPSILIVDSLSFLDLIPPFPTNLFKIVGVGAQLTVANTLARTGSGGTAIYAEDGCEVRLLSSTFRGFQYGLHVTNVGNGPLIRSTGVNLENTTYDVFIENALTTGYLSGYIDYAKQSINAVSSFFITDKPVQTLKVAKRGGDFTSIAAAVDSITDAAIDKPYLVLVGAGEFIEPQINLQPYISIAGLSIASSIIIPDGNHHVFNCARFSEISFLSINGIGASGKAAIYANDIGDFSQAHKITIDNCDIGILVEAATQDTIFYAEYVDINGQFTHAAKMYSPNAFRAICTAENFYTFPDVSNTADQIVVDGNQSEIILSAATLNGSGSCKGITLFNDAHLEIKATLLASFTNAIETDAASTSEILAAGNLFDANTLDINILSATAFGHLTGFVDHAKLYINPACSFFIAGKDLNIVTVAKRGGDHTSIADAINNITDSSITNRYIIKVGPGVFIEPLIDLTAKPYITIEGVSITGTVIEPDADNHHVFDIGAFNDITNLTIKNAGSGFAAINMDSVCDTGEYSRCHRIEIIDCDIGINIYNSNALKETMFYSEFVTVVGTYSYGTKIENVGGVKANVMSVHYNALPLGATSPIHFQIKGAEAELNVHACMIDGTTTDTGFIIQDGANTDVSSTVIKNANTAISLPNIGAASTLNSNALTIEGSTTDVNIQHPTATVTLSGTLDKSKVINESSNFDFLYLDGASGEIELSNQINMTFTDGTHTDISTLITQASSMGIMSGGALTDGGGFVVNIASGFGYYAVGNIIKRKDWTNTSITLSANVNKYIYFNNSGVLTADVSVPDSIYNIFLGRVKTNGTGIEFIDTTPTSAFHTSNEYAKLLKYGLGPIYESGSIVSENSTPFHINVTSGRFYFGTSIKTPSGGTNISFREYYQDGLGDWTKTTTSAVRNDKYDDGSGTLIAIPNNKYVKHSLFVVADGTEEKYFLVLSQAHYDTILEAQQAGIPTPPSYFNDGVALIANIIIQESFANIVEIQDARPRIGFKALGTTASSDHQSLSNRNDPAAHAQYLLRDGTNAMTANLDLGGFTITNNAALPGTTTAAPVTQNADQANAEGVASTKARSDHVHNIPTGVPVSVGTANAQGTANTFAKSDHVHSHGNQTSGSLHAVATGSVAGFISSTDKTKLDNIGGARLFKSGLAAGNSFTGNPKKLTITFATPFADTNYNISIISDASRGWTYESKTAAGFTINSNANTALTGTEISWSAFNIGETQE